ncbi:MAG TPA: hypothetical protein VHL80_09500, partial [Polyangia bacterium]|nr:hypothetical protein [Polyangia bacterium]
APLAPPAPIIVAPRPPPEAPPAPGAPSRPMLHGELKAELRGAFIVNLCYNTGTITPGSVAYYALPTNVSKAQFFVSPSNTVVGFKLSGLGFGSAAITGAMDVNLRSPTPLQTANTLSPQFYDVHMQLEFERWRLVVGQYPDVLLPVVPDTTNSYPAGYLPGALGYVSPQVRADVRVPVGARFQALLQGSFNRPIQTFQLSDELVGRQAGLPDVQGRVALALGASEKPWQRPFELGVAAHLGRRLVTTVATGAGTEYRTWSVSGDLRLWLPTGTLLKGRVWMGRLLGDYAAGAFQTVDTATLLAVRAWGFWIELQQRLTDRWRVTAAYGRDDPTNADLGPGDRGLNQAGFVNLLWDVTKTIGFGLEGSRWSTGYVGAPTARVWRGDMLFFLRF